MRTFRSDLRSALRSVVQDQQLIGLKRNLRVGLSLALVSIGLAILGGGFILDERERRTRSGS